MMFSAVNQRKNPCPTRNSTALKRHQTAIQRFSWYLFTGSILINLILLVVLFATLDRSQTYHFFTSDSLYLASIYRDLFIDHNGIAGWHLNGAPNIFPDMMMFFIIRSFFNSFIPATFVFSLLQLAILLVLLSVLYKQFFKDLTFFHLSIGTLLMSLFLIAAFTGEKDFNNYTYYLIISELPSQCIHPLIAALILLIRYLDGGKIRTLVWLFLLCIVAIINDRLFMVLFSIPAFALLVLLIRENPEPQADPDFPCCQYPLRSHSVGAF